MKVEASKRVQGIAEYPVSRIKREVARLKKEGKDPIDLSMEDLKMATPGIIRNYTKRAVDKRRFSGYPKFIGSDEFRASVSQWVKKRFNVDLDPNKEISSIIGGKEGLFNFPFGFINPGDVVLIPNPGYVPYIAGTVFAGGKPHLMPLLKENNFLPDLNKIPKETVKKSKILWINYPNNPTAALATKEFYKEAIDFCHDNNIILCSDEAYSENYFHEKDKPMSILELDTEGIVVFNSLSKRSVMTGYRVGWVAGDQRIIDIFKKLKGNIDSGVPTFIQDSAVAAYADESHVENLRNETKIKRNILCKALKEAGFQDCTPKATIYIWQAVPQGTNSEDFANKLLEKHAIAVVPGTYLSPGDESVGENHVRISLGLSMEDTKKAAERLRKYE